MKLFYLVVGLCASLLVFDIKVFFKGNLLLLTPVDGAEATTEEKQTQVGRLWWRTESGVASGEWCE